MPLLIDSDARTTEVALAVNHLLAEGGPRALSLRRIAATARVNGSSLMHHYGSMDRMLHVCAFQTGKARIRQIHDRWRREGLLAHLPRTGDHVVDARAWLAWSELWRSESSLEQTIEEARQHERALAARWLDFALARDELDLLMALLHGLTEATCRPVSPMRTDRARELLRRRYPHLGPPGDDAVGPSGLSGLWQPWTG